MRIEYIRASCHCTPLRMCPFCKKWLKPTPPTKGKTK